MSFSVENKDAPAPVPGQLSASQQAAAKRDKAMKAFMTGGKAQEEQKPNEIKQSASIPEPANAPKDNFHEAVKAAQIGQEQESVASLSQEAPAQAEVNPPAEAPKAEKPLSTQYAQLARQEKALRAKALELKQREAALAAKEAPKAPAEQPKTTKQIDLEDFRKSPWKYMQEAGVTYDEITQQALNAPSAEQSQLLDTISRLEAKLSKLEETQTNSQKSYEQQQKDQYTAAINQIRNDATDLVNSSDDYETIKHTGSIEDVVELIEKTFKQDRKVLSVEVAAKQVEQYLEEEAFKLANLKKIQNRLKPAVPAKAAGEQKQQTNQQQQPTPTLSNNMSPSRQLSARERAMLAFKNELK